MKKIIEENIFENVLGILHLPLPNPLKPRVKSRTKM